MRQLSEQFSDRRHQTIDGLRIDADDGWVLITPDSDGPYIAIHAEGIDESTTSALIQRYSDQITDLQRQ